ncbi:hypothetical protein BST36_08130 [Mycolicibacterium moriokaense]|jgi:hypothetical protein|uniref:Metallopeptidase DUF4344 n=1 Tax=Mycolicibacterium moriokaense TaxID=39691 RepID=A0AAD1M9K0_9MYCO|nr:DUF4344 domain-containing metallopeptidase [Mycolicibacterium moriokaense]MCV7041945.1 DUF4344 domain-containing metallopeptidase [Mycolicibacterium moriokaense]ORB25042.1 hypothetical protein BST36_08130 [Mycolicibacterium moriokaense]BBX04711.1 hypothetical protein MMOR_56470 [Mycolicibacterium moriokaense]
MRNRIVPVLAAALVLAGCAGGAKEEAESPGSSGAAQSADQTVDSKNGPAPEAPADGGSGGKMIVVYEDADTPEAVNGKKIQQENQMLEDLADDVNESLNLPHDVTLRGAQCGTPNAYWSESDNAITMCYEDTDWSLDAFTKAGDSDPLKSALGSEYTTFYHELAHMATSIYDLPITGREEDAADQAAAYLLLTPGEDGQDPESVDAVKDFARAFAVLAEVQTEFSAEDMADEHSLNLQRVYNLECWIYGSNPEANGDLVANGQLPQDRAERCPEEWEQIDQAWSTLLEPHWK